MTVELNGELCHCSNLGCFEGTAAWARRHGYSAMNRSEVQVPPPRRFDASYRETVVLQDGTSVDLRLVRREDAPLLIEGFKQLSAKSRYMRFFASKGSLSPAEVKYFTEIDGESHFAFGAVLLRDRREEGVGVARFVRLRDEPDVAEPAITVIDRLQGKGLGRILLERLIAAARERGIRRFRFEVVSGNTRMRNLVRDVIPDAPQNDEGTTIRFDVPLESHPPDDAGVAPRHPVLHRILSLAARSTSNI